MRTLNKQEIMDILIGCTILGTGGGGALKEGIEAVERELAAGKEFKLLDFSEIRDDGYYTNPYLCGTVVPDDQMVELVNPELIHTEGEQTGLEGCLSVPGKYGLITRPYKARVRAQDRNGKVFELDGEEIVARCFCHELEHLDGHLFVEHTDRLYTVEELEAMEDEGR